MTYTKDSTNTPIPLERFPHLHLKTNTPKGRGIFATHPIPAGTTIDTSPVLVLSPDENKTHIEHTSLYHYTYNWPVPFSPDNEAGNARKAGKTQAVVFGLGSLFNHSTRDQNVGWKRDLERGVVVYWALRDIAVGEELCISYGGFLTFDDVDRVDGEREVDEVEENPLGAMDVDGMT